MRYRTIASALMIAAGTLAPAAHAATPAQTMSARFRHVALHRLELKTGQPGARIHTACWPVGRQWRCAAVAFDEWGLVQNVGRFRFTRTRSSTGYSGPRGKRWIMTIPRHWSGHIYFWSIGQPMDPAPQ